MNFGDTLTFPMEDDDWIVTVLIGGALAFFGIFLLIPLFAVYGYMIEVMRGAVEGETEPPAFENWGDLFVDGIKGFVIVIAYQIVPMIVGGGILLLSTLLFATGSDAGVGLGALGYVLGFGAWGILGLVFGYVGMAGLVNFAVEDSLGAAFDVGTVKAVALSKEWLVAWAYYVGISIIASIVGSIGITAPFAQFWALSAGGRAFGQGYAAATGTATAAEPAETATV